MNQCVDGLEQSMADVAHGDDGHRYKGLVKANFSSNVWPFGMQPALKQLLVDTLDEVGSYPSPRAETVLDGLAQKHNIAPNHLMAVNGATEAIYLLAQAFSNSQSHVVGPTFGEYAQACRLHGHNITHWQEGEFINFQSLPQGIWWLCNPNNPTGKIYDHHWLVNLVQANPHSLFVVDEAYVAFSPQNISVDGWVGRLTNLVVLKSLTKSYAVPGIRTGYVMATESIIHKMRRLQPPWSVGSLALAVLGFSVNYEPFTPVSLNAYLQSSALLQKSFSTFSGVDVWSSDMGYFLMKTPLNASVLKDELIKQHGLLVRDASNFHGLGDGFIRIATQADDCNQLLMSALCDILHQHLGRCPI